mgnify:CR=1 FL=1
MQRKKTDKKLAVLAAATELFSENIFHEVRLETVAERAGVGKGTIYTYFKSKDELFVQCLVHDAPVIEDRIEAILGSGRPFFDSLKELVALKYENFQIKGPLIQQIMMLGPQLKISSKEFQDLTGIFKRSIASQTRFFQKAIDQGILKTCLTAGQAAIIFDKFFTINLTFAVFKEPALSADKILNCVLLLLGAQIADEKKIFA